ncbi:hypothetical protein [Photobacterium leiognathi]|uniref:hypothetical protein n=1 Tax=Photobacterium leiognathi TaxID=553611 RepID=UPI002981AB30|nr:hypothetical protein [Photobacterium leiognathi]
MKNQSIALLTFSLLSCAVQAKVTVQDALNDAKYYANAIQGIPDDIATKDWKDNGGLPNKDDSKIDWDEMPAGTRCGTYVMSSGRVHSLTKCQGHNPRYSCPTGFSRQDFGYFEAGDGERHYNWCVKL